tara:strand:+ start:472 stop:741 length:270 start_codon:yes stop_codon:yes gene_type:complete
MERPQHDHLYWAQRISKHNMHEDRKQHLIDAGFIDEQRIELILHLSVSFLPQRMHKLSNKIISATWHDLPDNTKKTMFAVGIKGYRNKS